MISIPKLPFSLQLLLFLRFAEPDIRLGLLAIGKKSDVITSHVCDLFLQSLQVESFIFIKHLFSQNLLCKGPRDSRLFRILDLICSSLDFSLSSLLGHFHDVVSVLT